MCPGNRRIVVYFFFFDGHGDRFHDEEHANLLNSMWLTAITFLCVGYGDIVPNTYCGRGITLTCGMVVSRLHRPPSLRATVSEGSLGQVSDDLVCVND